MERRTEAFFFFLSFFNKCRVVLPLWELFYIPGNLSFRLLTVKSLQSFYKPLPPIRDCVFVCAKGYGPQQP